MEFSFASGVVRRYLSWGVALYLSLGVFLGRGVGLFLLHARHDAPPLDAHRGVSTPQ